MWTIQDFFLLGMKREISTLISPRGEQLNLGAGFSNIENAINLDLPEWDATKDPIPYNDECVDTIHAYHFLEHFTGEQVIKILRECERVLKRGGTMNIVVPHRIGSLAFQNLDHKSFWTEDVYNNLFYDDTYIGNRETPWLFNIRVNVIIGIAERNLCLMTQLERI